MSAIGIAAISARGLAVEYRTPTGVLRAVDGVDLAIERGEVYALLGENGAGKTSTVEVLEGHRRRIAGEVSVLGHDPAVGGAAGRVLRDRIGIVLQSSGVESELRVAEAVSLYGSVYRSPRSVDDVLELVDLTASASVRVDTLSGGQRRRLDLALGIVGRPEVLFLDEPTTGFDPSARRRAWDLVRALCSDGTTVLLTTHYLDEAEHLADRIGVMSRGRIVVEGTPDDIRSRGSRGRVVVRLDGPDVQLVVDAVAGLHDGVDVVDSHHVFSSMSVADLVSALVGAAGQHGVTVDDWEISAPSLEDAFIDLISDDYSGSGHG